MPISPHARANLPPVEPIDVADQGQVQTRARSAKDRAREMDAAMHAFMSHKQGRAWVWDHLSACGVFRSSALASQGNPHFAYFYEGERNVGLRLMKQIDRVCPDLYKTMTEENTDG